MALEELSTERDLDEAMHASEAVLLKHGASCPISAAAREQLDAVVEERPDVPIYRLEVTGHRALSDTVAERLGVAHESPQAFVLRNGRVAWYAEHFDIKRDEVIAQLDATSDGAGA